MLTFLCIHSILLFLISFFLVHTWSIFFCYRLFITFILIINFFSSMVTLLFWCISILHVVMSISSLSTCFSKKHSFISYFYSFVVWLCKFFFFGFLWWFFFNKFKFAIGVRVSWHFPYYNYFCIFHCTWCLHLFLSFLFPLACIFTSFPSFFHHF